ncbi:M61 family metallopeptidase [Mucilaginibacter sp. JRF]|uniref:M61 family metallopeptidase n=1 Tax=Mucilaginibacter sp. JRF TaxID=2780088 RepID=UPI0018801824|nr:PDZ domain-containing protein [Mucilaginibacter sp. JRF]MBE9584713.1 M61 family metallopeptidase [Mucilaginibacter sp. JRF]
MKKLLLTAVVCLAVSTTYGQRKRHRSRPVYNSSPVYYTVSFPNAVHHEAEIVMTLTSAPQGPLRVRMSRSSPGRYATHEFGKNIYNVKAYTNKGSELPIKQIEGDLYEIPSHQSVVNVSYTLFGNWVDGTYAGIDAGQAHLNMPASFMWAVGFDRRPVKIQFIDLDKHQWKVSSQLKYEGNATYTAPNLQYMMDSPTELSGYKQVSWEVTNPTGKRQKINLNVYSDDNQQVINSFAQMVQKVVLEEQAVFGELPDYDYGEYTFINNVHSTVNGDGMEHRNSTIITDPIDKIEGNELQVLGTFSHEYFHSWNVERIRPKSLEPFDFTHSNQSSELWFAEGFTQYYGEMLLKRAGFYTVDDYAQVLHGLVNSVLNTPGAKKYPPVQMSRYAVFADAGVSIDMNNNSNIFTSYYVYGGATALALDLRLRAEFNLTLDDYMRFVWKKYGKTEKPYTVPMLQLALAQFTKEPAFASDFFRQYIYGTAKNNYEGLLANAGYVLRKENPDKAWAGSLSTGGGRVKSGQAHASYAANGLLVALPTVEGTPWYKAGIDAGDVILTIDGMPVKSTKDVDDLLNTKKPGDKLAIKYHNRSGDHDATLTLEANPYFEVVSFEKAGKTLTKEQETFRNNWLQSKVK